MIFILTLRKLQTLLGRQFARRLWCFSLEDDDDTFFSFLIKSAKSKIRVIYTQL